MSAAFFQLHLHISRAGVPNNIGERLLKNSEERRVQFRIERRLLKLDVNIAFDSRAGLKFVRLPFQGRGQAEMIEHSGTKLGGDAANHLNGRINVRDQLACFSK